MAKNIVIAEHRFAALYHLSTLADNPSLWFFTLRLISGIQVQFRLNPPIFYCILLVGYTIIDPQPTRELQAFWSFWTRLEKLDVPGCIISRSQFPSASQAMLPPDVFSSWRHCWSNESTLHPIISTKIRPGKMLAFNLKGLLNILRFRFGRNSAIFSWCPVCT